MQPGKHKHHPKFFFDLGELQINIYIIVSLKVISNNVRPDCHSPRPCVVKLQHDYINTFHLIHFTEQYN